MLQCYWTTLNLEFLSSQSKALLFVLYIIIELQPDVALAWISISLKLVIEFFFLEGQNDPVSKRRKYGIMVFECFVRFRM